MKARVRLDAQGAVRREWRPALPPASRGAILDEDAATAVANRLFPGARSGAALVWRPVANELRRFWIIDLAIAVPRRGFVRPRVILDAELGSVVTVEERTVSVAPRAYAYRYNPIVAPELEDVPLPGATEELASQLLAVRQCKDVGEIEEVDALGVSLPVHVCTVGAPAKLVDGDYYHDPVPYPEDPASDEDAFVAGNVFWNVRRGLDWFSDRGWEPEPDFDRYLWVTVNQRYPNYRSGDLLTDPRGPLVPYDNAFYSPDTDELVFGQGTSADFGYDADVVLHELGHFIVDSRSGPTSSYADAYGFSIEGDALDEAFADYFSSAITGNPTHGEYIHHDGSRMRNLAGSSTCLDRYGEPHYDGEPFAQALWAFRVTLTRDEREKLDQALLDSLTGVGEDATFAEALSVITAEVGDAMGTSAAAALTDEFLARGLDHCVPVVDVVPGPLVFRSFTEVPPRWYAWLTPVPGLVQFRVEIPEGGATLVLRGTQSEYLGLDPWGINEPKDLGVVGRAGTSLTWQIQESTDTYSPGFQWTHDGELLATFGRTGTHAHPTDPYNYDTHTYEARWTVREAGTFVFQLTNEVDREARVSNLSLLVVSLDQDASGCGCATPRDPPSSWVHLFGLAWALRRRPAGSSWRHG